VDRTAAAYNSGIRPHDEAMPCTKERVAPRLRASLLKSNILKLKANQAEARSSIFLVRFLLHSVWAAKRPLCEGRTEVEGDEGVRAS
jgi:hypothetical protein